MTDVFVDLWPLVLASAQIIAAAVASAHAVLHKRDVRAAIGWVGLIWLVPLFGSSLYALFGINRIQRRASLLRTRPQPPIAHADAGAPTVPAEVLDADERQPAGVARLLDTITPFPLTAGNRLVSLVGGTKAYAAMIDSIERSQRTIGLATYIFDADACGRTFASALKRAVARGVAVRVLIDGVGVRYSFPQITSLLRQDGVIVAEFLPSVFPTRVAYANLRNHRKILVVDGVIGFTGGMNIRAGHLDHATAAHVIQDTHFRLDGPVVGHLAHIFAEDWYFTTGEHLGDTGWFPEAAPAGSVLARAVAAGPDEDFERIRWAFLAALSQARRRVRILTPYFLPDPVLSTSLMLTAMRGVRVEIVLPSKNNLKLVQWASHAKIAHLLASGCHVWQTPPPFDHSKLMTVDGTWSMIGSANWDSRSHRLNFELNVECYDAAFTSEIDELIETKMAMAQPLTLERLNQRSLPVKLRDGVCWLLSPYL